MDFSFIIDSVMLKMHKKHYIHKALQIFFFLASSNDLLFATHRFEAIHFRSIILLSVVLQKLHRQSTIVCHADTNRMESIKFIDVDSKSESSYK